MEHYHKRSNIETAYSMIKEKFGSALRSKSDTGQINEVLCKALRNNVCVLAQATHELGIAPTFGSEFPPEPRMPPLSGFWCNAPPTLNLKNRRASLFKVAPKVNIVYNSLASVNKELSEGGTEIEEIDIVGGSDASDSAASHCSRCSAGRSGILGEAHTERSLFAQGRDQEYWRQR
jgi:hypothetical protein